MQEGQAGFRETIIISAEAEGRFVHQSGEPNQYALVRLRVEPLEEGKNIEFVNALPDDRLPQKYIQPIEDGVREAAENGILVGYPVIRVRVTLLDGKDHPVDSSAMAFKIASAMAFKEALRQAHPVLLEPIMLVKVSTPPELYEEVRGDLKRRGRVFGTEARDNQHIIRAHARQSEMLGYTTELRALTNGQASFSMKLSHYSRFEQ